MQLEASHRHIQPAVVYSYEMTAAFLLASTAPPLFLEEKASWIRVALLWLRSEVSHPQCVLGPL